MSVAFVVTIVLAFLCCAQACFEGKFFDQLPVYQFNLNFFFVLNIKINRLFKDHQDFSRTIDVFRIIGTF